MTVTLIWLGDPPTTPDAVWPLGRVTAVVPNAAAIDRWLATDPELDEFCLFWDVRLGAPPLAQVQQLRQRPGDVWHSGLCLGMAGLPHLIDFVNPVWRFNRDPDARIEATSWRLSLQACLVRTAVLQHLGGPDPRFTTLSGASLELGHRWLRQGALMRHTPTLLPKERNVVTQPPSLIDEFLFVKLRYGRLWHTWAFIRTLVAGYSPPVSWRAFWHTRRHKSTESYPPLPATSLAAASLPSVTISILIPTLDRYPYLFQLLSQLRQQTIPPHEIIVVDQTQTDCRQCDWPAQFADLPLRVIWRDQPGQCSSRNAGLETVQGDYILLLDDDLKIPPDLIAKHLTLLSHQELDASCGVVKEANGGQLSSDFTYMRDSDVFPAGNTLVKRSALLASGLFDLAYDQGERADGDLGMRLYLSGKFLILNPLASVIHLHAPRGGLRQHKARATTRANSRASIIGRHLLAPTEAYLWWRYFSPRQVKEACLIRTLASLRGDGTNWQKTARFILMLFLLPLTYYQNRQRLQAGANLRKQYPQIPILPGANDDHEP